MTPTMNDIAKLWSNDQKRYDKSTLGVVQSVNTDDAGNVVSYGVSLGDERDIVECRKFAGAEVGDTVLVTLMSNGAMVVTGKRDGDRDLSNLYDGLDDGSLSINGECLQYIGANDRAYATNGAMGFIGSQTEVIVNQGSLDVTYKGQSLMTVRNARDPESESPSATPTATRVFFMNIGQGDTERIAYNFDESSIIAVNVTYTRRLGLIKNSYEMEVWTQIIPNLPKIYYTIQNGYVYIHNEDTSIFDTTITSISVEFELSPDATLFSLKDKFFVDGGGVVYANGYEPITPNSNSSSNSASSREVKHDIKPLEDIDVHALYDIDVVQFKFNEDYLDAKDERQGKDIVGFIAEQVDEVFPIAVDHKKIPMWNSQILIPAMLKLIQEQHEEIEQLKQRQ